VALLIFMNVTGFGFTQNGKARGQRIKIDVNCESDNKLTRNERKKNSEREELQHY
jgi:hypothetical protein